MKFLYKNCAIHPRIFLEIFKTKSVWIFQLLYDGPAGGGSLYHKNHDRTLININICAHIHYPWSKKWQFFFKKSGYYTIRLVLYFKQNKHHSGQEKKIRVAIHKLITRYMIHILIIDFQYFFKECHTYDNKTKKVFFYF